MSLNSPEQTARQQIDQQLVAAGWAVQDYRQFHPNAARAAQCGTENSIA